MRSPIAFLKCVAKALVKHVGNAVGFGIAGEFLVEIAPEIVGDIWESWGKNKKEAERREEIEAVAQAAAKEMAMQIPNIIREVAADQPQAIQEMAATYLAQVPAMVRKSLRRDSDPTGTSVSANLVPQKAEDLISFLPPKLPRFKAGDRPLLGVDWELDCLLGVGGFGEVWKARNPHFDGVPSDLLDLMENCFEDERHDRPADAAALAERLAKLLEKVPAAPKPQPPKPSTPQPGEIVTNSLGMKFAWIPPGTFLMGSPKSEAERIANETQHKVTLSKGFYMGVHQVTQEQWQTVLGDNPSHFKGEKGLPVESVSWEDCQEFVQKLRQMDNKPYRLPTEAEWEYACRAGTTTAFHFGGTISSEQANFDASKAYGRGKTGKYRQKTTPVGSFPANSWGLFDTHGNVYEWCQDWLGDYPQNEVVDPQGPSEGQYRVLRGGSWDYFPQNCRSAYRFRNEPAFRGSFYGLRVCFCLD
jgi:formylglycine-generating enzyme required for sulfatase activity